MSGIGSRLRSSWPELTLGTLSAINVVDVLLVRQWEIVPFHLVWASLAVLYGFRTWTVRRTALVLVGVILVTGLPLLYSVSRGLEPVAELSEVPLISGIFLAMIWHAHRYQSAMAEMRRLAEIQREFIRDASHELRTPITVAAGHTELILSSPDPKAAADADVVLEELERLSRLADQLLLLAATGHPGFLRAEPTELVPFLEATVRRWEAAAVRDWRAELGTDGVVTIDAERMRIALDALIENAVKFTKRGDRITLAASAEDERAIIEISDSGPGIPPSMRDRVFDRFARADEGRARSNGGTGLGLAIVKAIVEAHGGTVSLDGAAGGGASFRIALPRFEPSLARTSSR